MCPKCNSARDLSDLKVHFSSYDGMCGYFVTALLTAAVKFSTVVNTYLSFSQQGGVL